jgi:hypothetical protein
LAVHNHVTARIDAHLPRMHLGAVVDDFTAGVRLEDTLGSASRLPLIYCDINVQQLNSGGLQISRQWQKAMPFPTILVAPDLYGY